MFFMTYLFDEQVKQVISNYEGKQKQNICVDEPKLVN